MDGSFLQKVFLTALAGLVAAGVLYLFRHAFEEANKAAGNYRENTTTVQPRRCVHRFGSPHVASRTILGGDQQASQQTACTLRGSPVAFRPSRSSCSAKTTFNTRLK